MPAPAPGAKKPTAEGKPKKAAGEETLTPEDDKVFLQRQLDALKLQLEKESMRCLQAELQVREHRERYLDLQSAIKSSDDRTLTVSLDMSRQYRSMREQLQAEVASLKAQLDAANALHAREREEWARERSDWEAKLAQCQSLVAKERERSAELTAEFASMLQGTIDKMGERMEVSNEWKGDDDQQPVVRTFEEFQLGKTR